MPIESSSDKVRQQALEGLINGFIAQGHPPQYAKEMAASIIFQTDLDLRNAQILRLLNWLKEEHENIYASSLKIVEQTREEFEKRVKAG